LLRKQVRIERLFVHSRGRARVLARSRVLGGFPCHTHILRIHRRNGPPTSRLVGYAPEQRARGKEAGLTYRGNLQSCRVFRGGRWRALRLIATAPAESHSDLSRFPARSCASAGSLPHLPFSLSLFLSLLPSLLLCKSRRRGRASTMNSLGVVGIGVVIRQTLPRSRRERFADRRLVVAV